MLQAALKNAIAPTRPMSWIEAFILASATAAAAVPTVAGLYLVKSALGINLMAGPSPLHEILYHLIV